MIYFKISLICLAISVSINWHGMILFRLKEYLEMLPIFIRKPLFECLICMSSFYSIVYFFVFNLPIVELPETILIVAGINTLISVYVNNNSDYGL